MPFSVTLVTLFPEMAKAITDFGVTRHRHPAFGQIHYGDHIVRQPGNQALAPIQAVAVAAYRQHIVGTGFQHSHHLAQVHAVHVMNAQADQVAPVVRRMTVDWDPEF